MSNETKNRLVVFWNYLWREVHRGNFIPLAVTAVVTWFIVVPTYGYIDAKLEALFDTDKYLIHELEMLKEQVKHNMEQREPGHVGITYH